MAENAPSPPIDPAATAFALGAINDPAMREDVREYLKRQSELAALQIEDLKREDAVRHWSLRIHHISDVLKLGFELAAAILVTAVVIFISAAVWDASHDHGLVIEAFAVPADMSTSGLTGQVVATQVQDRLAWMQDHTDTIRQANAYANNWANDIKVQIPDTGVSIGDFYRYLVGWLGHQTRITGEVYRGANVLTLSARVGDDPASVYSGADLAKLVSQASEGIYRQTQPYRFTVYLGEQGRSAEHLALIRWLALNGSAEDRPWAYSRWGTDLETTGDLKGSFEKQSIAEALNPSLPHVVANLAADEMDFGHDEAALAGYRRSVQLLQSPAARQLAPHAVAIQTLYYAMTDDEFVGDYRAALAMPAQIALVPDYSGGHASASIMQIADLVSDHDISGSRKLDTEYPGAERRAEKMWPINDTDLVVLPLPSFARAVAFDDWRAAQADLVAYVAAPEVEITGMRSQLPRRVRPWLAYADAKVGDAAAAHSLIDKTPRDCYLCVRMRANIDAAEKNWNGAVYWFAEAVKQAPSIPFAYAEWGAMIMHKGDLDGAIAKFKQANEKGPHYADPLEMWGEALIAKNRSDLALAKFEEAKKYAPNWGRLHLKWGEALWWSGKKDEARKQFAIAAHLDLTPAEQSQLARFEHG